jgi:hypothetical protein
MNTNTWDAAAIATAILSFLKAIPWPEVAAFCSAVYMVLRIYYVLKNKGKG